MIAHDKGKPAAKLGRKAVNLSIANNDVVSMLRQGDCLVTESDQRSQSHEPCNRFASHAMSLRV
jgi:hypothetical protein